MKCNNCGTEQGNNVYCESCGVKLENPKKFCHNCGKELEGNVLFCPQCGVKVESSSPIEQYNIGENPSTLNTVALVLGIISIVLSCTCCLSFLSLVIAPIGVILGIVFLVKHKEQEKGKAIAGLILSLIAFFIALFIVVLIPESLEEMKEFCELNPDNETCRMLEESLKQLLKTWR